MNLGNRSHGRTRVAVGRLLVNRNGWAKPFDEVDIGSVDLPQELTGISAQRFDVASLTLGKDRVECQRGLARTA